MYGLGDGTPIVGPVLPAGAAPGWTIPTAPAGYWVNPANPTQWLTQADAAKIGGYCFQGPVVGKYAVGGNGQYSTLFCENLGCQQTALIYGGAAAALFAFGRGGWKWFSLLPAAYAALNCLLGGVSL